MSKSNPDQEHVLSCPNPVGFVDVTRGVLTFLDLSLAMYTLELLLRFLGRGAASMLGDWMAWLDMAVVTRTRSRAPYFIFFFRVGVPL